MPSPWDPLRRRISIVHLLWQAAIEDLTLDQINHHERAGVLPLAVSFLHVVTTEDRFVSERLLGLPMQWESERWAAKIGGKLPGVRRGAALASSESVRFGDLDAWRAYQTSVFGWTEAAFAEVPDERFAEVAIERVPPDPMSRGFVSLYAGDQPLLLGDLLEIVIYQHGIRHLGEVEHGRALVGLRGLD